jgi:cytochrome oxidase Cu insertion factor (SCO1/SenC/PrrC family)
MSKLDDIELARALHVLFITHWIGGVAFITLVALPLARAQRPWGGLGALRSMRADERALRDVGTGDPAPSSASAYNLDSKWTTQDGASVALDSFAGKPVVAVMGYTTCRDICPATMADMMWIEKHLPADTADRVHFAFFSFDSEADTPERLRLYAESHGLDLSRWTFLRADDDAARELAAALGVGYRPNGQGASTAPLSFLFSMKRGKSPSSSAAPKQAQTSSSPNWAA